MLKLLRYIILIWQMFKQMHKLRYLKAKDINFNKEL